MSILLFMDINRMIEIYREERERERREQEERERREQEERERREQEERERNNSISR